MNKSEANTPTTNTIANDAAIKCIILLLLTLIISISAVSPPFSSPDEHDHLRRAYLLTQGVIVLEGKEQNISGGMINAGLEDYINEFQHHLITVAPTNQRISQEDINWTKSIEWSDSSVFSPTPGTGYYFPIIYTPQALGLIIGKKLHLSIDQSYRLARLCSQLTIAFILLLAFNLYKPNIILLALLAMPMTLFQMASTSLDGVSTALLILSISAFFRLIRDRDKHDKWHFYLMLACIFIVVSCRVHMLPILLIPLYFCLTTKNKQYWLFSLLTVFSIFLWLSIAISTTIDPRANLGNSTSSIALSYISHPIDFFNILIDTLQSNQLSTYGYSFVGKLGWLDTPFDQSTYNTFYILLLTLAAFSISSRSFSDYKIERVLLLLLSIAASLIVFFAILVTWTPPNSKIILGVQGRYFLMPAILLAYAISDGMPLTLGWRQKIGTTLLIALGIYAAYSSSALLVERYYQNTQSSTKFVPSLKPSLVLHAPTKLLFLMHKELQQNTKKIKRIGLFFGTYVRVNTGVAVLSLRTTKNESFTTSFDLSELKDNQYKFFDVPLDHYAQGEIAATSGGGVSLWEFQAEPHKRYSCIFYELEDGSLIYTPGCPQPKQIN